MNIYILWQGAVRPYFGASAVTYSAASSSEPPETELEECHNRRCEYGLWQDPICPTSSLLENLEVLSRIHALLTLY